MRPFSCGHTGGNGTDFLCLVTKPRLRTEGLPVFKDQRDFIRLTVTHDAALDILAEVLSVLLRSQLQIGIKWFITLTGISVELYRPNG